MPFIEAPTTFYMGRIFDPNTKQLDTSDVVYYDSRDLTTHAVVVGMTGSGKTGLCITLLEEAILDNVPAIVIDPKGDITNLLLQFPDLRPQDFRPWIHEDDALRAGMDPDSFAADVAQRWRDGLASWGISPTRIRWLNQAAQYSIFTPGSDAGLPISILSSLKAPRQGWAGNEEMLREKINGIVTALLALAGITAQPVKDKEHVLMANIFEWNWSQGIDLTLEDIILQVQKPPFDKLGVFPIDKYMSEKARFKLAMELNNVIAAPSFQSWIQGQPMDIQSLLYQPNGRPRVSIFYTAHLNESERQFITTLLLENMLSWMRTQSGTTSLRAILYIDELFGYFPPYPKNPPTKEPLMRLLKQARAYGVGLVLATQNPGDLDYKGLTNAGTWFIGRLQSENDRRKVMAGLQSLASADENLDLGDVEQLIADIAPRVFLMRNIHDSGGPIMVHTRWAMSYLSGPLTRDQIRYLMAEQRQALMAQLQQSGYFGQQQPGLQRPLPPGYGATAQGAPPMPPNMPPAPPELPPAPPELPGMSQPMPPQTGAYGSQGYTPEMPPVPGQFGAQSAPPQATQPTSPIPSQSGMGEIAPGVPVPPNFSTRQPPISASTEQYFFPANITHQQALMHWQQQSGYAAQQVGIPIIAYVPALFAQVAVRYQDRKANIYTDRTYAFLVPDVQRAGLIHWEDYQVAPVDTRQLTTEPIGQSLFGDLPPGLADATRMKQLQRELVDMIYNTARLVLPYHAKFKIYGSPDSDPSEFQAQVYQLAREARDAEIDKLSEKYGAMMDKLEEKLRRKQRELEAEQKEIRDRKREELFTAGEAVFSLFKGRTNYTLSRMSRATRYKRQTQEDLQESYEVIEEIEQDMYDLEQEYEQKLQEVNDRWGQIANQIEEYVVTPYKKDIHIEIYGIGWVPNWYLTVNGQPIFISAFTQ